MLFNRLLVLDLLKSEEGRVAGEGRRVQDDGNDNQ